MNSPSRSSIDPVELRLRNYSDRDQNDGQPFTSKELRECYRRAPRHSAGRSATLSRARCATASELVGWGMATGVWEAMQMPIARPHRADGQRPC